MIFQWKSLVLAESHYEIMEKLSKIKEDKHEMNFIPNKHEL